MDMEGIQLQATEILNIEPLCSIREESSLHRALQLNWTLCNVFTAFLC